MDEKSTVNYYVLFETYTQGMTLQEYMREDGVFSRIAPAPRSIQGELGCGMSLLILEKDYEKAMECIHKHHAAYYDIVALENQIDPKRNKFC